MMGKNTASAFGKADDINDNCRICNEVIGASGPEIPIWNTPVVETSNFICVPTIGSLVPGYLLAIPKHHVLSAAALDDSMLQEYWAFTSQIKNWVQAEFSSTIVFEHGPVKVDQEVGCGVDHAHFHIAPVADVLGDNILEKVNEINSRSVSWQRVEDIEYIQQLYERNQEYLLLSTDGGMYVGLSPTIDSQVFRKVIANELGVPGMFDWNEYSFRGNVRQTLDILNESGEVELPE